ncbi:MAG: OadG family protein [Clostridium sp.]|nr:OadG family protein [Clostridium sp.]
MKRKCLMLAIAALAVFGCSFAQNRKALKINEVMVQNESSIIDDYGNRGAWIELYNSNFGPLEISSVFLTNDSTNKTLYPVPLGDERTKMGKRQMVIFFADADATKGTFHTNFTLTPGEDNWIGIYDADGLTLIDEVVVPASLPADASLARVVDENGEEAWEVRDGSTPALYITPNGENTIRDTNHKVADFAKYDPNGFGMAIMAMGIVFCALLLLCLAFKLISKIGSSVSKKNKAKAQSSAAGEAAAVKAKDVEHDSGEEIAAICMALYQHLNAHDTESAVLTINKVKRAYSPWNSKIYSLRQMPR